MTFEIIQETPISSADLKANLQKIEKRDGELGIRAGKTLDHLNQFVKISAKQAKEIRDELNKLKIPRLKEVHIEKLIDILPQTPDDAKFILQAYTLTISKENLTKIVKVLKKVQE